MASRTIREYAVTLKADAKGALDSLNTFRTVVDGTQTFVTNAFATMSSSVVKSTNEMNAAIDKLIMAESKLSGGVFQKATDDMKKAINDQKLSAEERVKIKQETVDKLLAEEKRLSDKTAPLKKQKTPTPAASKAPTGVFKFDITEISANIDSVRQLQKGLVTSSSELNFNMRSQFQKLMADNVADVKDGQKELTTILEGARDKQLQEQSNFFKSQIDAAKGQPDKINQLTKESMAKRGQIIEQAAAQIAAVKSKAAEQVSRTQDAEERRSLLSLEDAQRDRLRRIIESNKEEGRTLRDKERVFRDAQKDIAKALGSFKLDILQIEKDEPIKDMRTLGSVLANTQKETDQRLKAQLRKFSGNKIGDIDDAEKKIIAILTEASKKRIIEAEAAHKKMLGVVGKNKEERLKLEKEFGKQRVQIEKQTNAQIAATSQTAGQRRTDAPSEVQTGRIGAGGKIFGKIKGALGGAGDKISAIGQGAADQVPGLGKLSGGLQNVLAKAGPYGKAAAAVVGATVAVGAVMVKAAAKADLFNRAAKGLENATGFTGDKLAGLKDQLLQIPRPASQSAEEIAKLAGNVAKFEKPENILATTKSISELQRISPDTGLEEVSAGVGRLTKAFGDSKLAVDILATTAQALKGKTTDPLGESVTEVGTIFSKATLAIGDTGRAAKESAILLSTLTNSGFEIGEATSSAEEIFLKLNDAITDPKLAQAIKKDLPEGMKLADVGIDGVNSSAVKFVQFMEEGGDAAKKVAVTMGSTAGEALQILQSQFKKGGDSIDTFAAKFENIEGAAGNIAASLTTPMQAANEKLKTSFDRLFIGVGQSFAGSTFGVDILADAMAGLADFMLPIGVQLDNQKAKLAEVNGELSTLDGLSANIGDQIEEGLNIDPEVATAALKQVVDNIGIIEKQSPVVAAQIKAIGDSKLSINEKLIQTQNLLKGIQNIAEGMAIVESFETQTLALEKFNETLNDSSSIWSTLANVGDTILDIGLIGAVLPDFSDMIDADQFLGIDKSVTTMKEKFAGIQEELTTLNPKTDDWKTKMEEAREVSKELTELQKTQTSLNSGFESQIQDVLTAKLGEKGVTAETLDIELLKSQIVAGQGNEALRESAEFNEKVRIELEKQLGLTDEAGNAAVLKAQSAADEVAATSNLMSIKTQLASTDDATKEAALSRLESLFTEGAITDELLNKKASEAGLTNELNAVKLESLNADMSALEAKKLINGTLDEADAKELAMLEKKMQSTEADLAKTQSAEAILATQEQILVATIAGIEANQAGSQMLSEEQTAELAILNTKLEKVNAEQLSIDLKAQAAELTFAEADANEAIALQIEEKLGFEEASNEEKLKAIEALQTENAAQIALVETEITGLKATIAAEDAKKAVLEEQRKIKNDLLKQEGKEPIAIQKSTNAQREKLAELETQLGVLKAAGKALGTAGGKTKKSIALDKGLGTERIKAARQARRDQKKLAKDKARDAEKERKKAAKDAENERKKASKAATKNRKASTKRADKPDRKPKEVKSKADDFLKQIEELEKKRLGINQEIIERRKKAEDKFIDSLFNLADKFKEATRKFKDGTIGRLKQLTDPFRSISEKLADEFLTVEARKGALNQSFEDKRTAQLKTLAGLNEAEVKQKRELVKIVDTISQVPVIKNALRGSGFTAEAIEKGSFTRKLQIEQRNQGTGVSLPEKSEVKLTTKGFFKFLSEELLFLAKRGSFRLKKDEGGLKSGTQGPSLAQLIRGIEGKKLNKKELKVLAASMADTEGKVENVIKVIQKLVVDSRTILLEEADREKAKKLAVETIILLEKRTNNIRLIGANKKEQAEKEANERFNKSNAEKTKIIKATSAQVKDEREFTDAIVGLEKTAVGFVKVNELLQGVLKLQEKAALSTDAEEAARLYNEADFALAKIDRQLTKSGLTTKKLNKEFLRILDTTKGFEDQLEDNNLVIINTTKVLAANIALTKKKIGFENESAENLLKIKNLDDELLKSANFLNDASALSSKFKKDDRTELEKTRDLVISTGIGLQVVIDKTKEKLALQEKERNNLRKRIVDLEIARKEALLVGDDKSAELFGTQILATQKTLVKASVASDKLANSLADAKDSAKDLKDNAKGIDKEIETEKDTKKLGEIAPTLDKRSNEIFGLLDTFSDKASAIGDAFELGEEGSEAALKSIGGLIQDTASQIAGLIDASGQVFQDITKISDLIDTGDSKEAVAEGAELATKVGKALLNAPGPLAIAGAVILGVGLVAKAIVAISELFGAEKKVVDLAEMRKIAQENILSVYDAQIDAIDTLQQLESKSVDTANERLTILQKAHQQTIDTSELNAETAKKTDEELSKRKSNLETGVADLTAKIANTEDEDAKARLEQELKDIETELSAIDLEIGFRIDLKAGFDALRDELESALDLTAEFSVDLGDTEGAEDALNRLKDVTLNQFADAFHEIGLNLNDLGNASTDQLKKMFLALSEGDKTPAVVEGFTKLLAIAEQEVDLVEELTSNKEKLLDTELERLDASQAILNSQKELGLISQDEFDLGSIELLNERLALLKEHEAAAEDILAVQLEILDFQQAEVDGETELIRARERAGKITEEEAKTQILDILEDELALLNEVGASELRILEVEAEILELKEEQNEQDMEAERLLTDKVRNLQKVLDLARAESGGGTPTAQGKEQITQAREDIVTELKAQGRSDEFINEFLNSLPKFKEGGFNPGFGLAEPGEFVFKAPTVAAIGKDVLNMINKNPFALGNMQSDKIVADTFLKKEAAILTQNNNTDIFLNMNVQTSPGQSATQIGNAIGTSVELKLVPTINKLFQQNKINSSLGGAQ